MNHRLISRILGRVLLLLGGAQLLCLMFVLLDPTADDRTGQALAFLASAFVSAWGAGLMSWHGRASTGLILRKEAIAVVGLGWMVCTSFGAIPFMLCEPRLGIADSLFESVSGFTTTGATVMSNLESVPRGLMLWRCLTQWLGGMGILVLFVALLTSFRIGSKAIFRHESSAKGASGMSSPMSTVAMRLWQIYIALSAICFVGLKLLGMSWFDAACHTFTVLSTGGFGTHDTSIAHFDSLAIELWLILFMILGSISFMLYALLLQKKWKRGWQDEETKWFLAIVGLVTLAVALDLFFLNQELTLGHGLRVALFQVVAIVSTTGFTTSDFNLWPPLSGVLLLLLMMIGGCAGSTAGGVKLSRWVLFFKMTRQQLLAAFRPNQVTTLKLNGSQVVDSLRVDTVFFIALAGVTVLVGTVVVSVLEPDLDMASSVSSVLATLFNIGPGLGAVGPTHNFAGLTPVTKIFLSVLMIMGRLEFSAVLVLFMPSLWRKY